MEYSDIQSVVDLVHLCALHGVKYAVISPGSRNAPLSITFNRHPDIETIVIPDERVAGFVAMGLAQQTALPVVLCCTSGSAALNYAPALAEAFYQRIPLLVVTADRPVEMVDQGDGQTIRQKNVYANYIRKSVELKQDAADLTSINQNRKAIEEAIFACTAPIGGPVHINFPLSEPLYNTKQYSANELPEKCESPKVDIEINNLNLFAESFNSANRVLVVCGLMAPNKKLNDLLGRLGKFPQVAILTESTSNLSNPSFFPCIDRLIFTFDEADLEQFQPDIIITLGVQIISKKIKAILRSYRAKQHWHIDAETTHPDTFQCLTHRIHTEPLTLLSALFPLLKQNNSNYNNWLRQRDSAIDEQHEIYMKSCPFSDHKAIEYLLNYLPAETNLHLGNSASVRYVQLFKQGRTQNCNANRGTSGIDGCTSTAIGAALAHGKPTVLITGDMAFLYDSNAFWQKRLPTNLKIVVLNNAGGGIFRIIEGPSDAEELENYFEAHHHMTAKNVADMFNLPYASAQNEAELANELNDFFLRTTDRPAILEIFTPRLQNAPVLKSYFRQLQLAKMAVN